MKNEIYNNLINGKTLKETMDLVGANTPIGKIRFEMAFDELKYEMLNNRIKLPATAIFDELLLNAEKADSILADDTEADYHRAAEYVLNAEIQIWEEHYGIHVPRKNSLKETVQFFRDKIVQ